MIRSSEPSKRIGTNGPRGFRKYDGRRFAIVAAQFGRKPVYGTARFERDDLLGNVLRIPVECSSPGSPDLLIAEKEWNGLITDGTHLGCDFCIRLLPSVV